MSPEHPHGIEPLAPGVRLGPYCVEAILGAGGMGAVYKARDTRLNRFVAIKVSAEQFSSRFNREARTVAALNHPNICTLYDVGPNYLVMEYLQGETLARRLRQGPLPIGLLWRIALELAGALDAAHRQGIVHRDLKPANVMVTADGTKLLDFGIAKISSVPDEHTLTWLTGQGDVVGTPQYMSPEQLRGQNVDARSDLWALGVVLYEAATGVRPFEGATSALIFGAVLESTPATACKQNPAVPVELSRIIGRLLERDREVRYQTAADVRADLKRVQADGGATTGRSRETSFGADASEPSVAVLPFVDMSPGRDHEWFSDGIADEIINVLARTPGLKVISRTSAFVFKDERKDIRRIAEVLGVRAVLEGSVRTAGTRVRVAAQLISASDGSHLWSDRYDRDLTDVFAVQDEAASAIAAALKVRLSPRSTAPRGAANVAAYQAYLKARYHWFRSNPDSLALFREFVDHAVELDADFALAHSLLGSYYMMLAGRGVQPAHEAMPLARASEEKALSLDPTLPEARAMLAVVIGHYDFNWKEAERQWQLALAQTPVSPDVRFWYGNHYLLQIGRAAEAVDAMTSGLEEDPLNLLYRNLLALALCHTGRYDEAEGELRRVLETNQNYARAVETLAAVHTYQGRFEEALPLAEKACSLMPSDSEAIGRLAGLVIRSGDMKRTADMIAKLSPAEAYGIPLGLAVFHAMCGESDKAAGWAAKAIEQRHPSVVRSLGPLLGNSAHWSGLKKMMNLS